MLVKDAEKVEQARKRRKELKGGERSWKEEETKRIQLLENEAREKGQKQVYEQVVAKKRLKEQEGVRLAKELKEVQLQRQYNNAN